MSQEDPKEDASSYLIRCMDTRQKILFACKEEDENDLKYSPELVQGLFKWSVVTELINDTIRMSKQYQQRLKERRSLESARKSQ